MHLACFPQHVKHKCFLNRCDDFVDWHKLRWNPYQSILLRRSLNANPFRRRRDRSCSAWICFRGTALPVVIHRRVLATRVDATAHDEAAICPRGGRRCTRGRRLDALPVACWAASRVACRRAERQPGRARGGRARRQVLSRPLV